MNGVLSALVSSEQGLPRLRCARKADLPDNFPAAVRFMQELGRRLPSVSHAPWMCFAKEVEVVKAAIIYLTYAGKTTVPFEKKNLKIGDKAQIGVLLLCVSKIGQIPATKLENNRCIN